MNRFLILLFLAAPAFADAPATTVSHLACRSGETWNFSAGMPQEFVADFHQFLDKKSPVVRGFSEALALRRLSESPEQKYFAEYWVSRALYGAKMPHIAKEGFSVMAARPVTDETIGVQLAALECLAEIHDRFPSIEIPRAVSERLTEYAAHAKKIDPDNSSGIFQPIFEVAASSAIARISSDSLSKHDEEATLALLSFDGGSSYEALVRGLLAAKRSHHTDATREFEAFFSAPRPAQLERYEETARMVLARAYYAIGKYDDSVTNFKQISKSSNQLADSLQEMSWAFLMGEHYREAVGTAINLQRGLMRKTFAPEAPMVMAMALNEICQYPNSVNAATIFRKNYEPVHKWLEEWKSGKHGSDLYRLAVQFLRKQGTTPERIAGEWVRSSVFISDQEEINLLVDERASAHSLDQWGSREQTRLAQGLLDTLKDFKPKFQKARAEMGIGGELSSGMLEQVEDLKKQLVSFRRMQRAAPVWKSVLANHQKRAPVLEHRLLAEINSELTEKNLRMDAQLEEVAENLELIEVEIYNGASEDIVWQNAHPDYKKVAEQLDKQDADRTPASKVWSWGRTSVGNLANEGDDGEVWEDELGSFKADLVDNCSSREKYLALGREVPKLRRTN